jgi:O-antigen/teichoic acid export membrane protein
LEVASAKGNYLGSTLTYRVILPLLVLLGIGLLGSFDTSINLYQALLCYGGAWVLVLIPIAWQARGVLPMAQRRGHLVFHPRQWLSRSLSFLGFGLLNTLLNSSGLLVLGYINSNATETGYYAAVSQLTNIIVVLGTATNRFYLPELSRIMGRNDLAALARIFRSRDLIVLGVSAIYLLVVLSAGQPLLHIFGNGYEQGWLPWLLLSAALCINIRYALHAAYLQNAHHDLAVLLVLIAGVAINFALLIPLTLKLGILGAAISTAVALIGVSLGFKLIFDRVSR